MLQQIKPYADLLRLSNVLTPVADVWMGILVMTGTLAPAATTAALTTASVCLYLSGMVLNDVFDADQDTRERPSRPIPSGRISVSMANYFGVGLMLAGLLAAVVAASQMETTKPLGVAIALAACIVLYDKVLKKSAAGPVFMGLCRGLNVVLGMSAFGGISPLKSASRPPVSGWFIIAGIILYVSGVTYFARSEAKGGRRSQLFYSVLLSLFGVALLATGPTAILRIDSPPLVPPIYWAALWGVVVLYIGRRYALAILQPTPRHVQSAVGNAIQSIILIDAALAWGYAGQFWGLAILALWPPTLLLARFIPPT